MDYYGFWKEQEFLHNVRDLGQVLAAPECRNNSVGSSLACFDPLEAIRSDAHEDFMNNGVDVELDELDKYQTHLRERTTSETLAVEQNPVLMEYLQMKERRRNKKSKKVCVFCKNNGEQANVYQGHVLKDSQGRTSCPILRKYTCPLCGTNGDLAHTIRYCPQNEGESSVVAGLAGLLKTNRLSTGKKRKC